MVNGCIIVKSRWHWKLLIEGHLILNKFKVIDIKSTVKVIGLHNIFPLDLIVAVLRGIPQKSVLGPVLFSLYSTMLLMFYFLYVIHGFNLMLLLSFVFYMIAVSLCC